MAIWANERRTKPLNNRHALSVLCRLQISQLFPFLWVTVPHIHGLGQIPGVNMSRPHISKAALPSNLLATAFNLIAMPSNLLGHSKHLWNKSLE